MALVERELFMSSMRPYLSEIVVAGRRRFLQTPGFGNGVDVGKISGALSGERGISRSRNYRNRYHTAQYLFGGRPRIVSSMLWWRGRGHRLWAILVGSLELPRAQNPMTLSIPKSLEGHHEPTSRRGAHLLLGGDDRVLPEKFQAISGRRRSQLDPTAC